jgi:hypothetical protein
MRKAVLSFGSTLLGFALGNGAAMLVKSPAHEPIIEPTHVNEAPPQAPIEPEGESVSIADDLAYDQEQMAYEDYVVRKQYRRAKEYGFSSPEWIDVSYAIVERNHKRISKLDADIYFGLGNTTTFGFAPLLGGDTKQLIVSQDVSRGGKQWIARLRPGYKVIFDGPAWQVGREIYDMQAIDLDGDGAQEITVPITDFYDFMDKMYIGEIPLPTIIFRYDAEKDQYFPANPIFSNYALKDSAEIRQQFENDNKPLSASKNLGVLLDYVYAGQEEKGWEFFDRHYNLPDKKEFKTRVRKLLRSQPVYRYLYKGSK